MDINEKRGIRVRTERVVLLGVAASDAHAVANHLIAYMLRVQGFTVVNLGTCTPIAEFCDAFREHPDAEALIIGSLNGHAAADLADLLQARVDGLLPDTVIVGGNLSVGAYKTDDEQARLRRLGVDRVVSEPAALPAILDEIRAQRSADHARVARWDQARLDHG